MNEKGKKIKKPAEALLPYLSAFAVWALAFGCSVGWGAFVMPGTTFLPIAGPIGTTLGMAAGTGIMLIIAKNYHYMMEACPDAGGTFTYTSRVFGYDHGFLGAWFLGLTYIAIIWANMTAIALICRNVFGELLQFGFHYQLAGYDIYLGEVLMELFVLYLLGALCMNQKRLAGGVQTLLAVVLIAGILVCFFVALSGKGGIENIWESFSPAFYRGQSPFLQIFNIIALAPWAFIGFESVSHSVAEFRFPVKKSFFVMVAALVTGFIAYALLNAVAVLAVPQEYGNWQEYIADLSNIEGIKGMPVFYLISQRLGQKGFALLAVTVLAGIFTGVIGNCIAVSRLLYSMAREEILPKWFGTLDHNGTPKHAILFQMLISSVIPFFGRTAIGWIVDVTTIGATIAYGYTSAAAYKRAKNEGDSAVRITGIIGMVMSIFFSLFLLVPNLWSVSALAAESYLILAFWSILGFVFFRYVFSKDEKRRFGKSIVVWAALLFLIFFTSMMWMRQSTHKNTEHVVEDIRQFYSEQLEERRIERSPKELKTEGQFLQEQMAEVQESLLDNSIIQFLLIMLGLGIMFSVYIAMSTRQKQMELQKIQAEQNSQAKSAFLSNMSHDIRTPMNAIIGYTNLAKREETGLSEMREYLDKIEGSSRHLLALINDVLEMSRIESGKMELEETDTDLGKMMEEIHDMFSTQMREKKIHFSVKESNLTDRVVKCDKNRLNRVLLNLISNAYKFTPEGGTILVEFSQKEKIENGRTLYGILVKDSGIGMTKEFAAKVFEAFERERTSTVSGIQGTGLGMAITKNIIDLMGGDITVHTAPGKGTEFRVELPLEAGEESMTEENTKMPEETSEKVDFSSIRLLLVEDNEINMEIAEMLLEDMGFKIETAVNGQEAVEKVEASGQGYYDAVLMDIQMPVMNGYDATKKIRSLPDPEVSSIPVIAMTADAFREDVQKAMEVGMNAHISKPIDVDLLSKVLTNLFKD